METESGNKLLVTQENIEIEEKEEIFTDDNLQKTRKIMKEK
jgi:hypothetical protein